ncbi:Calx-beta domain-containing protein [Actinoplanes sp. NPDC049548]|uniref:Calx-beta domain-containing protein n=1 Tax=Actinoplanes sp. NPDC049548 TaxID=3155152 RepID=UPI0034319E42
MRYQPAHAAKSGSVPFMLRGPKSVRTVLSTVVAGAIAFAPAVLITSPAQAAAAMGDADFSPATYTVNEGESVTLNLDWDTVNAGATPASNLTWITVDGSAKAASGDYTAVTAGTVTFDSGTKKAKLIVDTKTDALDEADETFKVRVLDGATTIDEATVTIKDTSAGPTYTMTADKVNVNEKTDTTVKVTLKLTTASDNAVQIPVSTSDVTAKQGSDYTKVAKTVAFSAGDTEESFDVTLTDDDVYEGAQTFTINAASDPTVTGVATPITITITDDETVPTVSLDGDATALEGADLKFPVKLSGKSEAPVTVKYDTSDLTADTVGAGHGVAVADKDYTKVTGGTVTITSGTTANAIVKTSPDALDERTEDLRVTLSAPSGATLGSAKTATGSISDTGSTPPSVTLTGSPVEEGSSGAATKKTFVVKLSKESGIKQVVHYDVSTKSAAGDASDQDVTATMGDLTFNPGELEKTFTVDVIGDKIDESNEKFYIKLSAALGSDSTVTGGDIKENTVTITDDDDAPTYTVNDIDMTEGDQASVALYTIKLSNPTDTKLTFDITKNVGGKDTAESAVPGSQAGTSDFALPVATATIEAGQTEGYAFVLVNGDDVFESTEKATFTITPKDAGSIAALTTKTATASLTLKDDDTAPQLAVVPVTGNEGETVDVMGVVTGQAQAATSFFLTLTGGTATPVSDYDGPGAVSVPVGAGAASGLSYKIASVKLVDDTTPETAETIQVTGVGVGTVKGGTITIAESDGGKPTPVTLKSSASYRLGVGPITLSGTAAVGANLTLWGKPVGAPEDKAYEELGTTTANSKGGYIFKPEFTTTGWWFKVTDGENASPAIKVNLKEDPDLYLRSSSKGAATVSVYGDPRVPGLSVRVLRNTGSGWVTAGSGKLDENGKYVRTFTGLRSGSSVSYKALIFGDSDVGLLTNYSNVASVTIR